MTATVYMRIFLKETVPSADSSVPFLKKETVTIPQDSEKSQKKIPSVSRPDQLAQVQVRDQYWIPT